LNTPRKLKYGLEDRPPLLETLSLGLQWFFVLLPGVIIIGNLVGRIEFTSLADQALSLRKIAFVCAVILLVQRFRGHRRPRLPGPSTILLVGSLSSRGASFPAIYRAMILGGILLAAMGRTGLFGRVRRFFTPRVIAVVLLLIAFTLCPAILDLFTRGEGTASPFEGILFATGLPCMILLYRLPEAGGPTTSWRAPSRKPSQFPPLPGPCGMRGPGALVGPLSGTCSPFFLDPDFHPFFIVTSRSPSRSRSMGPERSPRPPEGSRGSTGHRRDGNRNVFAGFLVSRTGELFQSPGMILSRIGARIPLVLSGSSSPSFLLSRRYRIAGRIPSPVIVAVLLYSPDPRSWRGFSRFDPPVPSISRRGHHRAACFWNHGGLAPPDVIIPAPSLRPSRERFRHRRGTRSFGNTGSSEERETPLKA
jgi:hypothetical protein